TSVRAQGLPGLVAPRLREPHSNGLAAPARQSAAIVREPPSIPAYLPLPPAASANPVPRDSRCESKRSATLREPPDNFREKVRRRILAARLAYPDSPHLRSG